MNDLQTITSFLGWCSVINVIVLALASVLLMIARNSIAGIHSKMFGVTPEDMSRTYVQYLSNYKIAIVMLNIVPYVALRIIG